MLKSLFILPYFYTQLAIVLIAVMMVASYICILDKKEEKEKKGGI